MSIRMVTTITHKMTKNGAIEEIDNLIKLFGLKKQYIKTSIDPIDEITNHTYFKILITLPIDRTKKRKDRKLITKEMAVKNILLTITEFKEKLDEKYYFLIPQKIIEIIGYATRRIKPTNSESDEVIDKPIRFIRSTSTAYIKRNVEEIKSLI